MNRAPYYGSWPGQNKARELLAVDFTVLAIGSPGNSELYTDTTLQQIKTYPPPQRYFMGTEAVGFQVAI